MLDSIYYMTLSFFRNHVFVLKALNFSKYVVHFYGHYFITLPKSVNHL